MHRIHLFLLLASMQFPTFGQGNSCSNMTPICEANGSTYQAVVNSNSLPAGNDYDCLTFQPPNPNWFYFQIATSGTINMQLVSPPGTDLDFVIWGPFSNQQNAINACGNLGHSPNPMGTVDCGALGGNTEQLTIPGALLGDVYVFLVINYGGIATNFTLDQTGGWGAIGCSPCNSGTTLQVNSNIINDPSCYYLNDGSASIVASNLLGGTPTNYEITNITWTSPSGLIFSGGFDNDTLTNMESGVWSVSVQDTCFNTVTTQFNLTAPTFPPINLQYSDDYLTTDFISYDSINTTYQWYNCNNEDILGETNDSLKVFLNGDYYLSISINGCVDSSDCFTVSGIGLPEHENTDIQLTFNTSTKSLKVISEKGIDNISIYTIDGKQILSSNAKKEMDLTQLIFGVYIVDIESKGTHFTRKIVLK